MNEDHKKRVAIFRFGVISDFFARDYRERGEQERLLQESAPSGGKAPSPTALGCRTPPSWDGSGSIARAAVS
ncbi:hypothetical protein DFAR_320015 [Desulfarculales bacterium]